MDGDGAGWHARRSEEALDHRRCMIDEQDRIRRHIRIFVNGEQAGDLSLPLTPREAVVIVQALSGG